MYQDCHRSSCRLSCIRSPSRLSPWQLQPLPDTRGSSRALQAQVPRVQTARLLRHLRPGWSSHGPPCLHASPNPWAPEGPPSTCRQQCPPQQDNRLTKYELLRYIIVFCRDIKPKSPSRKVGSHICNTSGQLFQALSSWIRKSWNLKNCLPRSYFDYLLQISNKIPFILFLMLKYCLKSLYFRLGWCDDYTIYHIYPRFHRQGLI